MVSKKRRKVAQNRLALPIACLCQGQTPLALFYAFVHLLLLILCVNLYYQSEESPNQNRQFSTLSGGETTHHSQSNSLDLEEEPSKVRSINISPKLLFTGVGVLITGGSLLAYFWNSKKETPTAHYKQKINITTTESYFNFALSAYDRLTSSFSSRQQKQVKFETNRRKNLRNSTKKKNLLEANEGHYSYAYSKSNPFNSSHQPTKTKRRRKRATEQGIDPPHTIEYSASRLRITLKNEHSREVKILTRNGRLKKDSSGRTPLSIACERGDISSVYSLLQDPKLAVDQADKGGWSPLHFTCEKGHSKIVSCLINHHAKLNQPTYGGWTPLYIACQEGHTEVVKVLLATKRVKVKILVTFKFVSWWLNNYCCQA